MNISKLQSEAVKTFLTEGTKNGCGDLSIMVSVLTDQIQKAYYLGIQLGYAKHLKTELLKSIKRLSIQSKEK